MREKAGNEFNEYCQYFLLLKIFHFALSKEAFLFYIGSCCDRTEDNLPGIGKIFF